MARELRVLAWPKDVNAAVNAYTSLQYAHMGEADAAVTVVEHRWSPRLLLGRWDVWHVHWPEYYLGKSRARRLAGSAAVLGYACLCRVRGTKVVWTVHNLRPHEYAGTRGLALFYGVWLRVVSGLVHLSHAGAESAVDAYPRLAGKPARILWHGPYRVTTAAQLSRADARHTLSLSESEPLVGFVGAPRPYKGLAELTAAHAEGAGVELLLVGAEAAGVRSMPGPLDQQALEAVIRACDLVALPYRSILNSGSMVHVLSAGGRVLVPEFGSLVEAAARITAGTATFYDPAVGLTSAVLRAAVEAAVAQPDGAPLTDVAVDAAWLELSRGLAGLYRELTRSGGAPGDGPS